MRRSVRTQKDPKADSNNPNKATMGRFLLLLFLCHFSSSVKHSLKFFFCQTSGVQNIPEFVVVGLVDGVQKSYYDSNTGRPEPKTEWMKKLMKDDPQHLEWYTDRSFHTQDLFKGYIENLRKRFNQTEGVHILQSMNGCEWDDETGEVNGLNQYGYDGEDFLTFDPQRLTWIALKPQAVITKLRWDGEEDQLKCHKNFYDHKCPEFLKKYVQYGRNFLQTAVLPSVSLLQRSSSSPVSCHATGFYPDRGLMFWRKDGEELHEGVDPGEILPNHDGTFQLNVDLKLPSFTPEDWERYDCVFQLSGVNEYIVTKLDKAVIRTNWGKPADIRATVVVLAIVLIAAVAAGAAVVFVTYKRKKERHSLKYFITASSGNPNISEFMGVGMVDGVEAGYCDLRNRILEIKQDWAKKIVDKDPRQLQYYTHVCFENLPPFFTDTISTVKQDFNQTGGVHFLQRIDGCEWDETTGKVTGLIRFGYDGEDFIELDLKTLTWIALKPEAVNTKIRWERDELRNTQYFLTVVCPTWLKTVWNTSRSSLQRKVLPSVSLLQKTPSSPVSCQATGFYPGRAVMFWRKDGEGLHEDVYLGEILPNNDETFQMNADLSVLSVTPEDWGRYDCVFQLSGGENIITNLNESVIRTNWKAPVSVTELSV